jgi:hypothetical protein
VKQTLKHFKKCIRLGDARNKENEYIKTLIKSHSTLEMHRAGDHTYQGGEGIREAEKALVHFVSESTMSLSANQKSLRKVFPKQLRSQNVY